MPALTHPAPSALGLDATIPVSDSGVVVTPPARTSSPDRHESGRLDHFVVDRKLGSGGMGAVYLARDASLDRPVAIKILPDELALKAGAQERFIREAQAQARLSSPHVVQIYFIGHVPAAKGESGPVSGAGLGSLYFAMELIDGGSLEQLLDRGERLDPEDARRLMIQVARGLRDAHAAGIVHRDIKPGNLLLDRNRDVKIADFGLAKPRDPKLGLTRDGAVMGTPLYMAPEQAMGETLDHRADMYALGCTFYHLLSGVTPFEAPTAVAMISKHLTETPVAIRARAPAVPLRLGAIIDRLLLKERDKRYASYDELIEALEAAAPGRLEYAGFWTRGAAALIDFLVATIVIGLLGWIGVLLELAYVTAAHALRGQTLGKYLLRIEVQRIDGGRLSLGRSLARTAVELWFPILASLFILTTLGVGALEQRVQQLAKLEEAKSLILFLIGSYAVLALLYAFGFALAAIHRQKRAVHDLLAGSQVVYRLGGPPVSRPISAPPG
ncbi:MAG: protein kinase [Byssovorax sp.]